MFRRTLSALLAVVVAAAPLGATWSIILVDTRTGEIAVGSATCLTGLNLLRVTPVIRVGVGAATAQALVNPNSITNRQLIWNQLGQGVPPPQILAALAAIDPQHQSRQYGIVDVRGGKVTFSGSANAAWAGGVAGSIGTIHYAIQGNILTGQPVITAAEQAVRNTQGDLAERLMAGMEAARSMGGDGRCSCSQGPTACGSPPASFTKSAHIGFMVVARQGDLDGTCTVATTGCASGSYYLRLNVANQSASAPDPVVTLRNQFAAWKAALVGRVDHNLTVVRVDPPSLVPDGASTATVTVETRDRTGARLTSGGARLLLGLDPASSASVTFGTVVDHNDGTYSFPITAGTTAGTAALQITVDDGIRPVLLSPRTLVEVRNDPLWASTAQLSGSQGGAVDLRLDAGGSRAGRAYAVALSASGTSPGIPLSMGAVLPLNPDPLFEASLLMANSPWLINTAGLLDGQGQARARLVASPGLFGPLTGAEIDIAYALLFPFDFASNAVQVGVR